MVVGEGNGSRRVCHPGWYGKVSHGRAAAKSCVADAHRSVGAQGLEVRRRLVGPVARWNRGSWDLDLHLGRGDGLDDVTFLE